MPTPRLRTRVSLAVALTVALALGGCASGGARAASDAAPAAGRAEAVPSPAVDFDNFARDRVHVYLVGERREWLLGRVEPMQRARLRVPHAALAAEPGPMRLVVLADQRVTLRAADAPRATTTMAQPAAALLAHQWSFRQTDAVGQLTALRLQGARAAVERR